MKVYVLTIEEVCDYDQVKQKPQLFYTSDDARAELKKCRDTLLESIQGLTWLIETDDDDSFLAFELGREAANRFSACISECEVIGNKPSFNERYQALAQEEIEDLRDALEEAGGSYRFEDTFVKVIADLGGDDYEFAIVRCAKLDDGYITLEVESEDDEFHIINPSAVLENNIHYITEEINK